MRGRWVKCEGPVQDDDGAWICPFTGMDDFDCKACAQDFDRAADREVEARWDAEHWGE